MTSFGLNACIVSTLVIIFVFLKVCLELKLKRKYLIISLLVTLAVIGGIWFFSYHYFNYTNSGRMAMAIEDRLYSSDEIEKTITVYTDSGETISYTGKYEVLYKDGNTILIGEGKQRSISGGTVIVDQDVIPELD